jgi:hypothetical protein
MVNEALQILTPSFKKRKKKSTLSFSQPTTLSRELSSSTASGQKKFHTKKYIYTFFWEGWPGQRFFSFRFQQVFKKIEKNN